MTGTDGQVYGLVYDDADWLAYTAGIWVMTQRQVTIPPGAALVLRRRIAAVAAPDAGDPWGPLAQL